MSQYPTLAQASAAALLWSACREASKLNTDAVDGGQLYLPTPVGAVQTAGLKKAAKVAQLEAYARQYAEEGWLVLAAAKKAKAEGLKAEG